MEGNLISQKLFLLGSPRLEQDGVTIRIGRRKALALLAYLAVTGQPQNRDALLPLLWPDDDTATARLNLRRDLSYLRKKVGAATIPGDNQQLCFEPAGGLWVDVLAFRELLTGIAPGSRLHPTVTAQELDSLTRAVTLGPGDFMAGFGLDEASVFEDWQYYQASALRHELMTALKRLIAAHSAAGQFDDALPYARRWLALDPLHEPAQRELLQLLAWSGQTAAALEQFALSRKLLQDELGVEPARETLELVEAIRARTLQPPDTPADDPLTAPLPPRKRHNLPAQLTQFVGRVQELAALDQLLGESAGRLITILGPGGMGKSRLALATAERQRENGQFPAGVFWLPLAPLSEPGHIVPALAAALDFPLQAEDVAGRSAQRQLLDFLSDKKMLLLLDNFEHLLSGAALLSEILTAAPGLTILTTSRERLRLQAEQLFHLGGLALSTEPDAGDDHPAAQLFLQAARRIVRDFDPLPTGDLPALNQICRLVEGMPLALELAAAWVNLLTLPEIVVEIQNRLDFLAGDFQDRPVRQRSIQAVFASAWAQLTPEEQRVFARLSVCRGGFSRAAAQAIAGASLHDLSSFCDRALLSFEQVSRRYTCHELLRQFAAEQLAAIGEAEDAAAAHAAYFLAAMAKRADTLEGPDQLKAINGIAADFENVRQAWEWVRLHQLDELLTPTIIDTLGHVLEWQGRYLDGLGLFRPLNFQRDPAKTNGLTQRRILAWLSVFQRSVGDTTGAEFSMKLCKPTFEDTDDLTAGEREYLAFWYLRLGELLSGRDHIEAETTLLLSRHLFEMQNLQWQAALVMEELGRVQWRLGKFAKAQAEMEACLTIRRELGDLFGLAAILDLSGSLARYTGRGTDAMNYAIESIALYQKLDSPLAEARARANLARVIGNYHGDYGKAISIMESSLEIFADFRDLRPFCLGRSTNGMWLTFMGRFAEAEQLLRENIRLAESIDYSHAFVYARLWLGIQFIDTDRQQEGLQLLSDGVIRYQETAVTDEALMAIGYLSTCTRFTLGQTETQKRIITMLAAFVDESYFYSLTLILPIVVLLWYESSTESPNERHHDDQMLEVLGAAGKTGPIDALITNLPLFDSIREFKANLPIQQVEAALARGRKQSIWEKTRELLPLLADLGWPKPYEDIDKLFTAAHKDIRLQDKRMDPRGVSESRSVEEIPK